MKKSLNSTLVEITRAQKPSEFRRDQSLIPNSHYQLNRIDAMLRKLAYDEGADITDGASDDEK